MTIDIIRRDTLAATHAPESPFKRLLADLPSAAAALAAIAVTNDADEPDTAVIDDADNSRPAPWPQATATTTD